MADLVESRIPRLLVVEAGAEPPVGADCCQDWMWKDGGEAELRLRLRQLALRALDHGRCRPYLDPLGILHVGLRSIPLPPKEQALVSVLLERFNEAVRRVDLVRAAWPDGINSDNTLAQRLSKLRSRLSWVGLEIILLPGNRYSLRAKLAGDGDGPAQTCGGFEDALQH
ncbi:MAG: winged helix-turn-helix domain-containing protein [Actinomycetota bacterium]|jgi:two-component system, OmpR family, response regulator